MGKIVINSEKKLVKILDNYGVSFADMKDLSSDILKEFVHKDNLPNVEKIIQLTDVIRNCSGDGLDYGTLRTLKMIDDEAKAIQKLIEGKK